MHLRPTVRPSSLSLSVFPALSLLPTGRVHLGHHSTRLPRGSFKSKEDLKKRKEAISAALTAAGISPPLVKLTGREVLPRNRFLGRNINVRADSAAIARHVAITTAALQPQTPSTSRHIVEREPNAVDYHHLAGHYVKRGKFTCLLEIPARKEPLAVKLAQPPAAAGPLNPAADDDDDDSILAEEEGVAADKPCVAADETTANSSAIATRPSRPSRPEQRPSAPRDSSHHSGSPRRSRSPERQGRSSSSRPRHRSPEPNRRVYGRRSPVHRRQRRPRSPVRRQDRSRSSHRHRRQSPPSKKVRSVIHVAAKEPSRSPSPPSA